MTLSLTRSSESLAHELTQAQVRAIAEVNQTVGTLRVQYATDIPFQDGVYLSKLEEARAYAALILPPSTLDDFPLIAAEIGITGEDADQVAQVVLNTHALWMTVLAQLENLRLGTVKVIEDATTIAAINAALTTFQATVEAL